MMMRYASRFTVMIAGCAVLLTTAQFADAQRQQQRRWSKNMIYGLADDLSAPRLVGWKSVQEQLKLTEDQAAKLGEISRKFRADRSELASSGQGGPRTMHEEITELTTAATAKVNDILDDAQKKRLQGIRINANGVSSLFEPDIAETLKITEDQQNKMEEARTAFLQSMGDLRETTSNMTNQERRARMREIRAEFGKTMLVVLSDEQQAAFESMKNAPSNSFEDN